MKDINQIFSERTYYSFDGRKIDHDIIKDIYDIMKLGPTSANSCPLRIYFVESDLEKEKLYGCLMPGNVSKSKSAPLVALFAYDVRFYELMPKLYPIDKSMQEYFSSSTEAALDCAERNSSLQAAYFMIIARSYGIDCGPMSGFNKQAIDQAFFENTSYKVNFICNLGYRDGPCPYPKLTRLNFDEACKIL